MQAAKSHKTSSDSAVVSVVAALWHTGCNIVSGTVDVTLAASTVAGSAICLYASRFPDEFKENFLESDTDGNTLRLSQFISGSSATLCAMLLVMKKVGDWRE